MINRTKQLVCALAITIALLPLGISHAQDATTVAPDNEQLLIAVLTSNADTGDKAITCKQLAIHGSSAAVPHLAPLLGNPELASWARIALEAIPGAEADAAILSAAESLDGLLLVGALNTIGIRGDKNAVP
ncbi:MAG: hypothetical protein KDA92_18120, partial [Planctomycetales bacterium]|nr:hypothetical protein [Planctomycetales bacterium]